MEIDERELLEMRLIDIKAGDLMRMVMKAIKRSQAETQEYLESRLNAELSDETAKVNGPVYGIDGIAALLHCSRAKVLRMKKDGKLEGTYVQVGKTIIVKDPERLVEVASERCNAATRSQHTELKRDTELPKRRGRRVRYAALGQ